MTGYSVTAAFSLDTVRNNNSSTLLGRLGCDDVHASQDICKSFYPFLFGMPERSIGKSAVAYGIERMNKEVSQWTRGLSEDDDIHNFPSMPVPRK
jgi:hypothetical protein